MSRDYVNEPIGQGWVFERPYIHKYRSPAFRNLETGRTTIVKLAGASWFPGCEDYHKVCSAWSDLTSDWEELTGLPLLTTPAATGKAFLWETLPEGHEFSLLPPELAGLVHRVSPQHRRTIIGENCKTPKPIFTFDGRWMYAACARANGRFPVGQARPAEEFREYQPGLYHVTVEIPAKWNHIGILPAPADFGRWDYPNEPGQTFQTWTWEPELTLAVQNHWIIREFHGGFAFERGAPLRNWAEKLIGLRKTLGWTDTIGHGLKTQPHVPKRKSDPFGQLAIREILNHTIGTFAQRGYEREITIPKSEFKAWRRQNPDLAGRKDRGWEETNDGYIVPEIVPNAGPLDIYQPHWAATIWSLERAHVTACALACPFESLIEINADSIVADRDLTEFLPLDAGELGRLRRKD
jgi:hypothetical protein